VEGRANSGHSRLPQPRRIGSGTEAEHSLMPAPSRARERPPRLHSVLRDVDDARFVRRIEAAGLGAHAKALSALARPSVRLCAEAADDSGIGIGRSKLGGCPDLPPAFEWPRYGGLAQSFVAQVDLDELQPHEAAGALPTAGLLSFFYDAEQRVWGFDPAEGGGWMVHHTEDTSDLSRRDPPSDLPDGALFHPARLRPADETTYAPWESIEIDPLSLTRDERLAYANVVEEDEPPVHRLLGYPQALQGDMQLECQLVSHGLYCGDETGYTDPRAADLAKGAFEWQLLLQVDSDDDAGMMWGDAGRIYYWIHLDALAHGNWQQARLVLQCH